MRAAALAAVLAYVMPAPSIIKRLASARDEVSVSALRVDGLGTVAPVVAKEVAAALGTPWSSGELTLSATISLRLPGRCRLDLTAPDSGKALSVVVSNGKLRREGFDFPAATVALREACALLGQRSGTDGETRAALEKYLAAHKVDVQQSFLARFAGTIALGLGARADGAAQLWVYQERFQPARLRFSDEAGTPWDVRLVDYTSQASADWFPRLVEVYRGQEPQLRLTVLAADGKPKLADSLF